jgi:acetylornithine/N-succinyldiaminopimelate aminotransferase
MNAVLRCSGYDLSGIEVVRAEGCKLFCADGREIVDFEAGVWCAALGHGHSKLRNITHAQIDQMSHIGYRMSNPLQEQAAVEVLSTVDFGDGQCVFLSSGSEAVELATQIARKISRKPLLLTLSESYLGAYGSAGTKSPHEWVLFDRTLCRDCPPDHECTIRCPHLESIPFEQIGAMVLEPGASGGLVRFPQQKLIHTLCENVQSKGGSIVVNEVTTGIGRTGRWFGYQHYSIQPDIVAIGKGLGNGYPISAVAISAGVSAALQGTDFHYAQSHQNDPLGCAIAAEVIRIMREEGLVERSAETGQFFHNQLEQLASEYGMVREVRGKGLLLAIEFESEWSHRSLGTVFSGLLDQGFLVGYKPVANLLRFFPPLTISEQDIERMVAALAHLLATT